jgi:NAD(P)-dependent dehydrogenase (short-subunit alcohol dehydrogenase family)
MSSSQKVVVVTGASQGIGAEVVKAFRKLDYRIVRVQIDAAILHFSLLNGSVELGISTVDPGRPFFGRPGGLSMIITWAR